MIGPLYFQTSIKACRTEFSLARFSGSQRDVDRDCSMVFWYEAVDVSENRLGKSPTAPSTIDTHIHTCTTLSLSQSDSTGTQPITLQAAGLAGPMILCQLSLPRNSIITIYSNW
jgi:hypothetical protein